MTARSRASRAEMFHVKQSHPRTSIRTRRPPKYTVRSGSSGSTSGVVRTKTRPPGRTSLRPSASHFTGGKRRPRDRDVERRRRLRRDRLCDGLAPRALDRHPLTEAELADRGPQERRPSSRSARRARPSAPAGGARAGSRAARRRCRHRSPELHRRASARARTRPGRCSPMTTSAACAAVRLMRAFQRSSDST